ncbi:DUF2496 domain-containing protein [Erwinia amylovora]
MCIRDRIKLAVDLIMLLEENQLDPATVLAALARSLIHI